MKVFLYCTDGTVKETSIESIQYQTLSISFSGKKVQFTDISDKQEYRWNGSNWEDK